MGGGESGPLVMNGGWFGGESVVGRRANVGSMAAGW